MIIELRAENDIEYLKLSRLGLPWRPSPHHHYDRVKDTIFVAEIKDLPRIIKV